jgi:hypothetical protein
MTEEVLEGLAKGFKYSLITLLLVILNLIFISTFPSVLVSAVIISGPALLLCWINSLKFRYIAWKKLNYKSASRTLLVGGILISLFVVCRVIFVWVPLLYFYIYVAPFLYLYSVGIPIYYLIPAIPSLAWILYTFKEIQGFKLLEKTFSIDMRFVRVFSLIGISVYAVILVLTLIGYSIFFNLKESLYTFVIRYVGGIAGVPVEPILFSSPFLIATCVMILSKIKDKMKTLKTQISKKGNFA